jgi:1,4-alpha-glucan branching enzyme
MLFMGEEWQTESPFLFFCNFGPELADVVREGRRAEFARFPAFQDLLVREHIPDPEAETSFLLTKLNWNDLSESKHKVWAEWYRRVLRCRRQNIVPLLNSIPSCGESDVFGPGAVAVRWRVKDARELVLIANLSDREIEATAPADLELFWMEGGLGNKKLEPWTVIWGTRGPGVSTLRRTRSVNHVGNDSMGGQSIG